MSSQLRPRVGVVFPGQGSQAIGMGGDIVERSAAAAELFNRAAKVLGYDLLAIVRHGPEEKLAETRYAQPAIFVTNCALRAAAGDAVAPVVSAGHSFAEYCSLTIAGALSFDEALKLVHERGTAMQDAADRARGGMAAIMGLDVELIRDAAAKTRAEGAGRVQLANFNSAGQIVISGDFDAVHRAGQHALEAGAKRVIPLNVTGAWHSELMEPAVAPFAEHVRAAQVKMPEFDVISNVDAKPYRDTAAIKENLVRSVTSEVLWHDTALRMLEYRLDLVVEFGASAVLAQLMKRLPGAPRVMHVADSGGVAKLREQLAALVSA